MANRFRNKAYRAQYDAMVRAYHTRHRDLVRPDGTQHLGNGVANNFWRGYENMPMNWDRNSRDSFAYACYRAGQDVRKAVAPSDVIPRPKS
jgi:hypothetical protein